MIKLKISGYLLYSIKLSSKLLHFENYFGLRRNLEQLQNLIKMLTTLKTILFVTCTGWAI